MGNPSTGKVSSGGNVLRKSSLDIESIISVTAQAFLLPGSAFVLQSPIQGAHGSGLTGMAASVVVFKPQLLLLKALNLSWTNQASQLVRYVSSAGWMALE